MVPVCTQVHRCFGKQSHLPPCVRVGREPEAKRGCWPPSPGLAEPNHREDKPLGNSDSVCSSAAQRPDLPGQHSARGRRTATQLPVTVIA